MPSLPHPIGGNIPHDVLGGVGRPSSMLSGPHCAPPAIVHTLPALTHAPKPSLVLPHPLLCSLVVLPAVICAPKAALWLLLLLPHVHVPSHPATDGVAADGASLQLFLSLLPLPPHMCVLLPPMLLLQLWNCVFRCCCCHCAYVCLPFGSCVLALPYCKSIISILIVIFAYLCVWCQLQIA